MLEIWEKNIEQVVRALFGARGGFVGVVDFGRHVAYC